MRRLNRRATGRRGLTDVLAFALPQPDGALLGDVYICPAAARRWVKNGGSGKGEEGRAEEERSEEHTSELQSQSNLVCRLLLEKKKRRPRSRCLEVAARRTTATRGAYARLG